MNPRLSMIASAHWPRKSITIKITILNTTSIRLMTGGVRCGSVCRMGIISFAVGCWPLAETSPRRTANGDRPTSFQTPLDLARHFFDLLARQLRVDRDSQRLFGRRFGVRKTAAVQIREALLLRKRARIVHFTADARAL